MPTVTKYMEVGKLSNDWARDFPNPKQVVAVTVTDTAAPAQPYQPTRAQQASLERGAEQIGRGEFVSDQVISDIRRKHECL